MKLTWIIFGSVMSLLLIFAVWQHKNIRNENLTSEIPQNYAEKNFSEKNFNGGKETPGSEQLLAGNFGVTTPAYSGNLPKSTLPDSIVAYGLQLMGIPYLPAGVTRDGFDCSGFIYHIFNKYGVAVPHSSALLAQEGESIDLNQVNKGDLLIFTGTTVSNRTPGHVGVVITNPGQPIEFVHASSVGGVKISKVAGTGYEKRFLQARRVLQY